MAPILVNLCIAYIYAVWYWRSILWSIDSYQIKVSADQYHVTISQAQVRTHRGKVFFWSWSLTRLWIFVGSRAQVFSQFIIIIITSGALLLGLANSIYLSLGSVHNSANVVKVWSFLSQFSVIYEQENLPTGESWCCIYVPSCPKFTLSSDFRWVQTFSAIKFWLLG